MSRWQTKNITPVGSFFSSLLMGMLLMLCLPTLSMAQYTVIEGNITKPAQDKVSIFMLTDKLRNDKTILSSPVDENGVFKMALMITEPMMVRFEHAFENMYIYIAPGERMKLSFETDKMWQTIKYEGDGADNNNYLVDYFNKFEKEVDQIYIDLESEMTPSNFMKYADDLKEEKMRFFKNYGQNKVFTNRFEEIAEGDILYNWAYDRIRYAKSKDWEVTTKYFDFLKKFPVENEFLLKSNTYPFFLTSYADYLYITDQQKNGMTPEKTPSTRKYELVKEKLNGDIQYYTQAKIIMDACQNEDIDEITNIYQDFDWTNPNPNYAEIVSITYNLAKKFAPGSPAPDFILTSAKGEQVSLTDFRGKVVYIAFWASWCNPCLQQIKYIKELRTQIDTEEMVFLYISIDEEEKAWKDMIAKKEIPGIHVRTPSKDSPLAKNYNLAGVPVYFMLDREGNFTSKPPIPSHQKAFLEKIEAVMGE